MSITPNKTEQQQLRTYAGAGNIEEIKALIKSGVDVNSEKIIMD